MYYIGKERKKTDICLFHPSVGDIDILIATKGVTSYVGKLMTSQLVLMNDEHKLLRH